MRLALRKLTLPGVMATVGTVALLATGCGTPSTNNTPTDLAPASQQVFKVNLSLGGSSDITTFDPDQATDSLSIQMIDAVFSGFVVLDKNLNVEKMDADNVTVSTDGLTYKFHMRPGLKYSDGNAVKASDYAYSMDRSLNPCVGSAVAYYLYEITDALTFNSETCSGTTLSPAKGQTSPLITTLVGTSIVPDDAAGTVTVHLSQPASYFLDAMTYSTSYAIEQSVVSASGDITNEKWTDHLKDGATGQGGDGMWYVAFWDHATGITLKQNKYWAQVHGKTPFLQEIDYIFYKSNDTAYAAYQTGQNDYGNPTLELYAQAKTQPDFHQYGTLTYYSVIPNWTVKPFDNADARQALCLAINRDQLNTAILKGTAIAHWNIVPKGMPGYNPNVTGPDGVTSTAGDTAKAQAHWQTYLQTLNGAKPPTITYLYVSSSASQQKYAQAIQAQWKQNLGINVALKGEDFTSYLKDSDSGNFQLERFGWIADYPDPQDFLTLLFDTHAQYNSQHASIPQADQLMEDADKNPDQGKRIQEYNQAEQLLINNVAACPLFQYTSYYQLRSYVHNYVEDGQGITPTDSWATVYISKH